MLSRGAEKDAHDFIKKMLFAVAKSYIRYLFTIHYYLLLPKKFLYTEKSEE